MLADRTQHEAVGGPHVVDARRGDGPLEHVRDGSGRADQQIWEAEAGGALIAPTGSEFTPTNPGPGPFEAIACAPAAIRATVGGQSFGPPWAA